MSTRTAGRIANAIVVSSTPPLRGRTSWDTGDGGFIVAIAVGDFAAPGGDRR